MSAPAIVTSAADIAAILDTVAPDAGTPLADTPIWNELEPEWRKMQARFQEWEAATASVVKSIQTTEERDMPPRPRKTPRRGPNKGTSGSSTRRAANAPQAPTEIPSVGSKPEAQSKEES